MDTDSRGAPERSLTERTDTEPSHADSTDTNRTDPPVVANEYDTVVGYIDFLRQTLAWKTRGLDIDQLRTTLPPSDMTLGGMLAHLSFVEDF